MPEQARLDTSFRMIFSCAIVDFAGSNINDHYFTSLTTAQDFLGCRTRGASSRKRKASGLGWPVQQAKRVSGPERRISTSTSSLCSTSWRNNNDDDAHEAMLCGQPWGLGVGGPMRWFPISSFRCVPGSDAQPPMRADFCCAVSEARRFPTRSFSSAAQLLRLSF